MASNLLSPGPVSAAQSGPIRIVPLFVPGEVKTFATTPHLVYNNGPLLTSVQVFTVFWGAAWQQSPLSDITQSLNAFFDYNPDKSPDGSAGRV